MSRCEAENCCYHLAAEEGKQPEAKPTHEGWSVRWRLDMESSEVERPWVPIIFLSQGTNLISSLVTQCDNIDIYR